MADVVKVLEACYRVDLDERAWLDGIAEAAAAAIGSPLGALVYLYDGSGQPGTIRFSRHFDPAWVGAFTYRYVEKFLPSVSGDPLALTTRALAPVLAGRCTQVSQVPSLAPMLSLVDQFGGARDLLTLNGYDPTGRGLSLGIPLTRRTSRSHARDRLFTRVTTHLAASFRLRGRLGEAPEAVLGQGKLLHADGEAKRARAALQSSALAYDRAHSRSVRRDPLRATGLWKGLVSGRWSLVDEFGAGGRRYLVARRNDLDIDLDVSSITQRERQVLAHASLGRSNKEIAYELGLADSTVRVLFLRAARKLGVEGRAEAVERYRRLLRK